MLTKTLMQKPSILVVSNTTDKLPEYNALWKDIKKSLKWIEEINNSQDKIVNLKKSAK